MRLIRASASSQRGIGGVKPEVAREFLRKTSKKKRTMFSKGEK